jgi:hypothetical protein
MVTDISAAGLGHSVVGQSVAASVQRVAGLTRPEEVSTQEVGVKQGEPTSASSPITGVFAQLRVRQDGLHRSAAMIRETDHVAGKADELLDKIDNKLGEIVKMYPPYPIDSPQRISLLNDIGGLRKQIDALTFPPSDAVDALQKLLNPQKISSKEEGGFSFGSKAVEEVKTQLWDIPLLDPTAATDEEVASVLNQVRELKSSIEDLQAGMWKDVVSFVKKADSPESENKATGVREQIADLGGRAIGSYARELVQAVESD